MAPVFAHMTVGAISSRSFCQSCQCVCVGGRGTRTHPCTALEVITRHTQFNSPRTHGSCQRANTRPATRTCDRRERLERLCVAVCVKRCGPTSRGFFFFFATRAIHRIVVVAVTSMQLISLFFCDTSGKKTCCTDFGRRVYRSGRRFCAFGS